MMSWLRLGRKLAAKVIIVTCGATQCSLPVTAAVPVVDPQDTLDRAVSVPVFINSNENTFNVGVGDQERFDDNLFRLSRDANVATTVGPGASRQDRINSPLADLTAEWGSGRQVVDLDLNVQDNRYSHNSYLNNVSSSDRLTWNWGVGGVLSGQVGADYLRDLVGFVNATSYARLDYQRTEYFAAGTWQVGPHVTLYGGLLDSVFSLAGGAQGNDSRTKAVDFGGELVTDEQNTFGLDYRYTDARYPNSVVLETSPGAAAPFNPDYRDDLARFLYKRALTDKTTLDVAVGYIKRTYADSQIGSFSGPTWRGTLSWLPSEKTQLLLITFRQLQSYLTDQTNYYRTTGVSLQPIWNATEKLTLALTISRADESFIGSSVNAVNQSSRTATVNSEAVDIGYTPTKSLTFDLSYRREQRSTNEFLRAYTDGTAGASVKFTF